MARSKPFKGDVTIDKYSGLRKLMRAMRRGKVPNERMVIIDTAIKRAQDREAVYWHQHQRSS